jgi:DNA-binding Lrp family transcriptional regulator
MRSDDEPVWIDPADARLLEHLHGGFPLVDRPFAQVADELGLTEDEVIERLTRLLSHGVLTRFGPLFQIERAGGSFVLAAMSVPGERFDAVALAVNAWPEVAHNYRRESAARRAAGLPPSDGLHPHSAGPDAALNMWFVVAAESVAAAEDVLQHIEADTGLTVWRFPKEREFKVELKLPIVEANDGAV